MAAGGEKERGTRNLRSLLAIASAWLPVALWACTIQAFAGDDFSERSTSRFVDPFLRWLFPEITPEVLDAAHFAIRKAAHAVEYAILALLARRAYVLCSSLRGMRLAAASLALVVAVALVDESRQALSAMREGAVTDVILDLTGGLMALAGVEFFRRSSGSR
jgi:VanZ family protein